MRPFDDITRIERAQVLDKPAGAVRAVVQRVLRNRTVKDVLHGVWLGHPLHPGLAAVTAGSFISATMLDAVGRPVGGGRAPSSFLIATGLALAFGDTSGGFRKLIQIVFGLSIAFAASSFFLSFFSFGGGALV